MLKTDVSNKENEFNFGFNGVPKSLNSINQLEYSRDVESPVLDVSEKWNVSNRKEKPIYTPSLGNNENFYCQSPFSGTSSILNPSSSIPKKQPNNNLSVLIASIPLSTSLNTKAAAFNRADSWLDHINGQVRPMCALDPVVRAVLCALLGCYGETFCHNDEESGETPPNHVLYAICCFVVLSLFVRVVPTEINVLWTKRAKFHLPLTHGKQTRAYDENCKSLAPVRDALRVKGIYSK
ncbi:hypothetical protein AgCh_025347 [Apium graveolens]